MIFNKKRLIAYNASTNFVEKEKFFKDKDLYPFKSMKYKSFDLSEQKTFFSNKNQ